MTWQLIVPILSSCVSREVRHLEHGLKLVPVHFLEFVPYSLSLCLARCYVPGNRLLAAYLSDRLTVRPLSDVHFAQVMTVSALLNGPLHRPTLVNPRPLLLCLV